MEREGKKQGNRSKEREDSLEILLERGEWSLSVWCAQTESTCSRERLTNRNKATLSIRYLANTCRNRRKYTYNLVRRRAAAHQTLQLALGMLDGLLRGLSCDDGRAWSVCVRERNRDKEKSYWLRVLMKAKKTELMLLVHSRLTVWVMHINMKLIN